MPNKLLVCMMACTWPSLVVTLSACSSEQLPARPVRSSVPLAAESVSPLQLSGGMAVKTLLDPVTGELRDPHDVEWEDRNRARLTDRPAGRDLESRSACDGRSRVESRCGSSGT